MNLPPVPYDRPHTLRLVDATGTVIDGDPIAQATDLLHDGGIVAIKGLDGYHLAVDAADEDAVHALRSRMHREDEPFAVMVPDLTIAARLCHLDQAARDALTSPRRPIVLLPRRQDAPIAAAVAPGNRDLGIMLPHTPLHHLLCQEPYVLTSGNVSDEPIACDELEAFDRLGGIADAFLTHNRRPEKNPGAAGLA